MSDEAEEQVNCCENTECRDPSCGVAASFCYEDIENQAYDIEERDIDDTEALDLSGDGFSGEKLKQLEQMMEMNVAILKLYVNPENTELCDMYREHIEVHNTKMSDEYPDSGFDLFIPEETVFDKPFENKMINLQIKTEMLYRGETSPFKVYPRSSLSKTPLMLSNHTGIVDAGYRGDLIGAFRLLSADVEPYVVKKHTRLLQICHALLCPIVVIMISDESELSTTERNDGGFGSTGITGAVSGGGSDTTQASAEYTKLPQSEEDSEDYSDMPALIDDCEASPELATEKEEPAVTAITTKEEPAVTTEEEPNAVTTEEELIPENMDRV